MALFKPKKKDKQPLEPESTPDNPFETGFEDEPGWLKIDFDSIQRGESEQPASKSTLKSSSAALSADEILEQILRSRGEPAQPRPPETESQSEPFAPLELDSGSSAGSFAPEQAELAQTQPVAPEQPEETPAPIPEPETHVEFQPSILNLEADEQGEQLNFDPLTSETGEEIVFDRPDEKSEPQPEGKKRRGRREKSKKEKKTAARSGEGTEKSETAEKPKREPLFTPGMSLRRRRYMMSHLLLSTIMFIVGLCGSLALGYFIYISNVFVQYINIILLVLSGLMALSCIYCYIKYLRSLNHEYDVNFVD